MIKKQSLIVFIFLCASYLGFGQTTIFSENMGSPSGTTLITSNIFQNSGTLSYSGSADIRITTPSLGYTGSSSGGNVFLANNATANFQIASISTVGYTSISLSFGAFKSTTTSNMSELKLEYSTDGSTYYTVTIPTQPTGSGTANWRLISSVILPVGSEGVTNLRLRWTNTSSGAGTPQFRIDDVKLSGTSTAAVDWCNLQSPASGSMAIAGTYNVYAQVFESGLTEPAGKGAGISVWIGYSNLNTNPNSWTNWVAATYNMDSGNNDEYKGILSGLASGTYYYASRVQLNGGPYKYGGYNGGFWDGSTNVSGVLTVDKVDWCNLQSPNSQTIDLCDDFEVYGQVYEFGVTDTPNNQGSGIIAEVGYSTTNTNPNTWTNWISTTYNPTCTGGNNCNLDQNDEYYANLGAAITSPGTYYYAMRYTLNSGAYSYGGILSDGSAGDFWDGSTYISGVLTVNSPPLANVVITEIMYNSSGTDDEWIEICNISGSTQDLSKYKIDVNGVTKFTFPCNTTIVNGDCITISLGSNGDNIFNNGNGTPATGYCPFTPDFGIGASTISTDHLANSSGTITLYAANGSTITDVVTYNPSDGGDGNGSSLHVFDATQDNADTGTNWREVAYGGSSGTNSLIPNCLPAVVEINVEGNLSGFPDIPDDNTNSNTPLGTNNTLFSAQLIGSSQSKTFRIQNLGSLDLTISSVDINGANPGDFSVTLNPISPIVYNSPSILEITFTPTSQGIKNAIVTINNNDSDENPYTFNIRGTGLCVSSSNTITPSSGPEETIVTVTGSNLSTATASFNGIAATTINHISSTQMEVTVPNGATTGNLEILDSTGCTSVISFTVIDNKISSCEGGSTLSEIFISEVTDATYGGLTYIELYNPTNTDINLSNYSIDIYINGNTNPLDTGKYKKQILSGTILAGQTFVISTGYSGIYNCDSEPGGDASYSDFNSTSLGGINKETNKHDFIGLYKSGTLIDAFGVFGDPDWMDSLHTAVSGDRGFDFRRLNSALTLPQPAFDDNDWSIIDWIGSGSSSCGTNDYSDIGLYDFSSGTPPAVASGPTIASSCNSAIISVSGTEGNSGGKGLAYQWYYSAPGESGWTTITNGGFYNNATSATLNIFDTSTLEGYQYYCQIREDDASCYTASDAVQLTLPTTTWDGTSWSSPPTIDKIAIIDGDYDTSVITNGETSFSACSLIINDGVTLTINDVNYGGINTYVEVMNNLTVLGSGSIIVQPQAAFVQINDNGQVYADNQDNIQVNKETAPMNNWYEYTYWSSPVKNESISDGLADASPNRRFWFNAQNYKDSLKENGNSGTFSSGQDDIDDAAPYDWALASGSDIMQPGVGYASTHNSSIFFGPGLPPYQFVYSFKGLFNNGIVEVPIYRNDDELNDNNWNFIGNPYPSAISADLFLANNLAIDKAVPYKPSKAGFTEGAIFFWSQNTAPSTSNSGNQNKNFSQDDYAIISMTGVIAGGDGVTPSRFIPSGQGFFIAMDDSAIGTEISPGSPIKEGTVTFNNSMRVKGLTNNSQFFRINGIVANKSKNIDNKLWVNLTSDNGVFNQLAVGYVDYATNAYDGMAYDTPRNLSNPLYSSIYTMIDGQDKKFAIQGKDPNSLNTSEIIPLGFDTTIDVSTLYTLSIPQVEGEFLTSNPIYLKDKFMNVVHTLSESDYTFTSQVGEFIDRFEIVFQSETLSDIELQQNTKKLSIIELEDGRVQFKINSDFTIQSVQIIDMLGRTLYQLKGTSASEVYNLNTLSQSAYIAKVELSNGQIITKQAVKRK